MTRARSFEIYCQLTRTQHCLNYRSASINSPGPLVGRFRRQCDGRGCNLISHGRTAGGEAQAQAFVWYCLQIVDRRTPPPPPCSLWHDGTGQAGHVPHAPAIGSTNKPPLPLARNPLRTLTCTRTFWMSGRATFLTGVLCTSFIRQKQQQTQKQHKKQALACKSQPYMVSGNIE